MIPVTLTYEGQKVTKLLPVAWHEVTWNQFVELSRLAPNLTEYTCCFLGLDSEDVPDNLISEISPILAFCLTDAEEMVLPVKRKPAVATAPWNKLIEAQLYIELFGGKMIDSGKELIRIYYHEDISEASVSYALPLVIHLWNELNTFLSQYEELGKSYLEAEEEIAMLLPNGESAFASFGWMASNMQLCGNNPLLYDQMINAKTKYVYDTLLYLHRQDYVRSRMRNK